MNPLPSRPTIAERLAAIDALLDEQDAALAEAARASKAIRAILAGEPRPPRYLTLEEAARHVAARLGATGDGDDDGPLFDGPVTTKADLDEAYGQAAQGDGEAAEMCDSTMPLRYGGTIACTLDDGHYGAHSAISGTRRWHGHGDDARHEDGTRILDGYRIADEVREQEEVAQLSIAPGGSAGPASLASVQVQADGSVTAAPPAQFPPCACGDPADAHADTAGTRRAPCFRPECTCPDYEIPADREHEILPVASTA